MKPAFVACGLCRDTGRTPKGFTCPRCQPVPIVELREEHAT